METRTEDPTAPGVDPAAQAASDASHGGESDTTRVTDDQTPQHAFHAAKQSVAQLMEYISYYIAAKTDAMKVTAKNVAIYAALGVLAGIGGAAVIVTACVLLLVGLAQAISRIFGVGPWLGNLVIAVLVLGGLGVGTFMVMKRLQGESRERTVKKYAARKQQQRAKFGQDVQQARGPIE